MALRVQCDILALDTHGRTRPADMKATTNPPEAKGLRPSTSRWLAIAIATGVLVHPPLLVAADDASIRASAGILMSRSMSTKDRVDAADSLARYEPRAAVPILIDALNETSEPVRRAAARGLWTIAANSSAEIAASARAAIPALRVALGDTSASVSMNAAAALERLGEPATALADVRRKVLRMPGPLAYERFLAARGLIGIEPGPTLTPYVLEWLFEEHRRAASANSSGARDNIRIANAALAQLVRSGDRGVLVALERELAAPRPGTGDLLRAMALADPPPERFAQILVVQAEGSSADIVATAYALLPARNTPPELGLWVPVAARALADPPRQEAAVDALHAVAGKTPLGMTELAKLAQGNAPVPVRVTALATLGSASDATKERPVEVVAAAKPAALQAFQAVLASERAGPAFDEAARSLRYTERDFGRTAEMYLDALKRNGDPGAQAKLLDYIGQAHSEAGPLADALRPYATSGDPRIRQAAISALDSIKPSWRESGERAAAVATGALPKPAAPAAGARGADLIKFYDALLGGDRAAIARLVNTGNVNLPMVMPNGNVSPQTPISGALQHCGLPQVASAKVASVVAQLVALGADVELRSPSGSTALDYAKAACPDDVQQALLGKTLRQ